MTILFEFIEKQGYIVATIADKTINAQRAKVILESIGMECQKLNCRKVLLNEMTVEVREIANHEISGISQHMPDVRLALICRPELIDEKSKLLSTFTFTEEYNVKHFSVENEAIKWLTQAPNRTMKFNHQGLS